ncbi:MAG: RNA polymerase sigma factor [Acidobacteria bacterium]|nr:RNA polymerase sigma factor [Acidobacteriota bacterium]
MPTTPAQQSDLIRLAVEGDSDAFGALIHPHLSLFHHGIYRILANHQDAQDALQDGLLAIYRGLPRFEGRSQFSSWAYRICINAALMHRRSSRRYVEKNASDFPSLDPEEEHPNPMETLPEVAAASEAYNQLEHRELRDKLMETLALLPPSQREVFVLRDIEDWSTEDIATQLGVTTLVVRQRLHRARDFICARLQPYFLRVP